MGHYVVRFQTNGTSDPTVIEDSAGILDVDNPITRSGQSQFRLNLKDRWVRVYAQAQLHEEEPAVAHVHDYEEATNQVATVYLRLLDLSAGGALNADTTGWRISVLMDLTSWLGRGET
jgi:hypothetical protein